MSTIEDPRELESLLERAAERLTAREHEVADLQSRLAGERQKAEALSAQLHRKEEEVLDLLKQKSRLEQQLREVQDRHDVDHRELQRRNTDLREEADLVKSRLREFEDQRMEMHKTKLQLEQSMATQNTAFAEQTQKDRALVSGLYEITQKFFNEMHRATHDQQGNLAGLREEIKRYQHDIQKSAVNVEGWEEQISQRLDALLRGMMDRLSEVLDDVLRVEGEVSRQEAFVQKTSTGIEETVRESAATIQSALEEIKERIRASHAAAEGHYKREERRRIGPSGLIMGEAFYADMMFGVSHQLRNPLGIIKANAQLCLKGLKPKARERQLLESIVESCDRMQARLDQFTELTKPIQYLPVSCEIPVMLDELIGMIQVRADEQKVVIAKNYATVPPVEVDILKMKQALLHVMVNALDAMPQKGTLTVEVAQKDDWCVIRIHDTGEGISAENLEKVWQPFFTTRENHLGLGLISIRHLAAAHRGAVDILSQEGSGTLLTVRLPFKQEEV